MKRPQHALHFTSNSSHTCIAFCIAQQHTHMNVLDRERTVRERERASLPRLSAPLKGTFHGFFSHQHEPPCHTVSRERSHRCRRRKTLPNEQSREKTGFRK
jgi:hypothetical protein